LLAPHPTLKLEDHPSSSVRRCLFNLFIASLHIGGHSSIRNLRTRHAVVTGTHIHGVQRNRRPNISFRFGKFKFILDKPGVNYIDYKVVHDGVVFLISVHLVEKLKTAEEVPI